MNGRSFPVARDVRVGGGASSVEVSIPDVKAMEESRELAASRESPGLVTVLGFGKDDVLLRSDKANCVQVRGSDGEIVAMLVRLRPNIWGFTKKGDDDWMQNLAIYGNPDKR